MTYALIGLAMWALWGVYFSIFPRKGDRNTYNILFWTQASATLDGNDQDSVDVQECGEYRLSKIVGITLGGVCTLISPYLTLVGVVFGENILRENWGKWINPIGKLVDIAGHGAEIMAAEKKGIPGYREREATSVARQYGMSHMEALEAIEDKRWLSRIIYALGNT